MSELGFYSSGNSYLHRNHPTTKILFFAVAVAILPLLTRHWQSNLMLILILIVILISAKVKRKQLLYFSPALALVSMAAIFWLFTNVGGNTIFEVRLYPLPINYVLRDRSVEQAVRMSGRALVWVLAYAALLTSTSSREMMAGLERLGLPHSAATAVGMTLKFWANVMADTDNVVDAQKVRGVDFERGRGLSLIKQRVVMTSLPTIFLMLKRFRTLSFALALRGFGSRGSKSRVFRPSLRRSDIVALLVGLIILASVGAADRLMFPT